MTTLTHLTGLDVTEVTRSLIPLIGGEPTDHGLRLVAVSDVGDGQAIEVTIQDTAGVRRHFHLHAMEVRDTVPNHYTDLGEWCPHSGQPHNGSTCPAGCSATALPPDRAPHRRPLRHRHRRHRPASHPRGTVPPAIPAAPGSDDYTPAPTQVPLGEKGPREALGGRLGGGRGAPRFGGAALDPRLHETHSGLSIALNVRSPRPWKDPRCGLGERAVAG